MNPSFSQGTCAEKAAVLSDDPGSFVLQNLSGAQEGELAPEKKLKAVFSVPYWNLGGVSVFHGDLARNLAACGLESRFVVPSAYITGEVVLPHPEDLLFDRLKFGPMEPWPLRWKRMIDYLEGCAPCVYLTSFDWDFSCVIPRLSKDVHPVLVVHSDEEAYFESIRRLGPYVSAIVCVSDHLGHKVRKKFPRSAGKVHVIPHGVRVPEVFPARQPCGQGPLSVIYAGRLVHYQKRVMDLPDILRKLKARGVPVRLTIAGSGRDEQELTKRMRAFCQDGTVVFKGVLSREETLEEFGKHQVAIMTSEFEGLPLSLLESMAQGCVPVVSAVKSGIAQVVRDGRNGFCVPIGDTGAFADRLERLFREPACRQAMAHSAYRTLAEGPYRSEVMTQAYRELFRRLDRDTQKGLTRRRGPIKPPRHLRFPRRQFNFIKFKLSVLADRWGLRKPPAADRS